MKSAAAHLLATAVLALLICAPASAESLKAGQIRAWVNGLADADPAVRDQARMGLMGLKRGDLDVLREVLAGATPLLPSQSALLKEAVTHVFLSEEPYRDRPETGFIGIRMINRATSVAAGNDGEADRYGVIVVERHAGFAGYRMLLNGDIILGIVEQPGVPIMESSHLAVLVGRYRAGHTINLQVLRQGQLITVPVRLNPRPDLHDETEFISFSNQRMHRADAYWQQWFAPLVLS